jgi:molybdopterin molybdotransferase
VTTGGVSVGDYDLTPAAMEMIGAEILFRGVNMKLGMACVYAHQNGKLICGLSGGVANRLPLCSAGMRIT